MLTIFLDQEGSCNVLLSDPQSVREDFVYVGYAPLNIDLVDTKKPRVSAETIRSIPKLAEYLTCSRP